MVWSDPDYDVSSFEESARGVGQAFGEDAVYRFLKENNLQLIVRSHQVVEDGYEFMFKKKVVTIFSAPNF